MALCLGTMLHLIAGLKSTAQDVLRFSQQLQTQMEHDLSATSPLIADCLYQAAATYLWMMYETGSPEILAASTCLTDTLKLLNSRWKVAGEYLKILDATKESLYGDSG